MFISLWSKPLASLAMSEVMTSHMPSTIHSRTTQSLALLLHTLSLSILGISFDASNTGQTGVAILVFGMQGMEAAICTKAAGGSCNHVVPSTSAKRGFSYLYSVSTWVQPTLEIAKSDAFLQGQRWFVKLNRCSR